MEKKAERLRYQYDDSIQFYQLPIDRKLFTKFKAQCIKDGLTIKDKITEMIRSSLDHI